MPRIVPVDPEYATQESAEVFQELKKTKWRIPTMYRVLAHHSAILKAHEGYFDAVMKQGALDRKLKEKVAFKVAQLNGCEYSTASHYRYHPIEFRIATPEVWGCCENCCDSEDKKRLVEAIAGGVIHELALAHRR